MYQELIDRVRHDPNFLKTIVTRDESWIFDHDPKTKSQSSQYSPHFATKRPGRTS